MKLPDKSIQLVAKTVGISPAVVRRLLGGAAVPWVHAAEEIQESRVEQLRLGLRLDTLSTLQIGRLIGREVEIAQALIEYRNCCPVVSRWLWSGGFNPKNCPAEITRGELVHSCRTAGRLRARLLRGGAG